MNSLTPTRYPPFATPCSTSRFEPAGECGRVLRQFAVEDLRLLQQQERQVGAPSAPSPEIAATSGWRRLISRIGLVPAPLFCRASRRSSSRSGPWLPATRQEALDGEPLRGAHVGDALAEGRLDHGDDQRLHRLPVWLLPCGRRAAGSGRNRYRPGCQRLQRLAVEVERLPRSRTRRPDRSAAAPRCRGRQPTSSLGFDFSRSMLSPTRK